MYDIEETGGARIGMAHASWPFAKLKVNKNELWLNASILGNLYFKPSDIIAIEPSSFFSGSGIKIIHRVEKYNAKVIFITTGASGLIRDIEATGFLTNKGPIPLDIDLKITSFQATGSFPIKISAVIAFVVIWNLLFLENISHIFTDAKSGAVLGIGAQLGLGFAFLTCLAMLISDPFRKLVLKEGRRIDEVKMFLYFLMFISGLMFVATCFIPNNVVTH